MRVNMLQILRKRTKVGSVACRSYTSLRETHIDFLDSVVHHGKGSVTIEYDVPKKLAILSISNETKRNAISGYMMNQLADAVDTLLLHDLKKEFPITGLIVRASGQTFCAGADLTLVRDIVNTSQRGISMSLFMTDAFTRLRTSGLISLCLINGPAVGGGSELITVCDYRLMVNSAAAHICFIHAKLGASPGWGGGSRLVSIVGRRHALRLLGTSIKISAIEALQFGLVDGIVDSTSSELPQSETVKEGQNFVEGDVPEYDQSLLVAAENFLAPWTDQKFPESVYAIKQIVASTEYLSNKDTAALELKTFGSLWGSENNIKATKK